MTAAYYCVTDTDGQVSTIHTAIVWFRTLGYPATLSGLLLDRCLFDYLLIGSLFLDLGVIAIRALDHLDLTTRSFREMLDQQGNQCDCRGRTPSFREHYDRWVAQVECCEPGNDFFIHGQFVAIPEILVPLKKKDAEAVRKAFAKETKKLPKHMKVSLTYDRGKEMSEHELFTKETKIQVYFADPYAPWQRRTNENMNGLVKQYFPKGTDFGTIPRNTACYLLSCC